jgi:hypothetical protein
VVSSFAEQILAELKTEIAQEDEDNPDETYPNSRSILPIPDHFLADGI